MLGPIVWVILRRFGVRYVVASRLSCKNPDIPRRTG